MRLLMTSVRWYATAKATHLILTAEFNSDKNHFQWYLWLINSAGSVIWAFLAVAQLGRFVEHSF